MSNHVRFVRTLHNKSRTHHFVRDADSTTTKLADKGFTKKRTNRRKSSNALVRNKYWRTLLFRMWNTSETYICMCVCVLLCIVEKYKTHRRVKSMRCRCRSGSATFAVLWKLCSWFVKHGEPIRTRRGWWEWWYREQFVWKPFCCEFIELWWRAPLWNASHVCVFCALYCVWVHTSVIDKKNIDFIWWNSTCVFSDGIGLAPDNKQPSLTVFRSAFKWLCTCRERENSQVFGTVAIVRILWAVHERSISYYD